MNQSLLPELSWHYLLKLYELSEGGLQDEVDYRRVHSELGYSREEIRSVERYLMDKDLISYKCRVPCVRITTRGIDEVEAVMRNQRDIILQKLYELAANSATGYVLVTKIAQSLGLEFNKVYDILRYWDEKRCVAMSNEVDVHLELVRMTPLGVDIIEQRDQANIPPTNVTYNTTVHGDNYGGIQQNTHNSTQNIALTNNQPIGEILPKLVELIEAVKQADFPDKEDVIQDLEKAQELAQGELTEGKWRRIQTKLTSAKTTMEIAGMAYKSLPFWPLIWDYFHR